MRTLDRDTLSYKIYVAREQELSLAMKANPSDKSIKKEFIKNLNDFTNKVEEAKWKRFCLLCNSSIENCKCEKDGKEVAVIHDNDRG